MPYATDEQVKLAESLGYIEERNQQRGSSFSKDTRHIWPVLVGRYTIKWQTADLLNNRFCNHIKFTDFAEAVARPISS